MRLSRYILRRLFLLLPVLLGVSLITFTISHVVPGDPARMMVGQRASEETVARIRHQLGLDQPLPLQYLNYVKGLLKGDLGWSIRNQRPVLQDLLDFFPATLELTLASLLLCLLVGVPLGVTSALKKDRFLDHLSRLSSILGVSLPLFWLGLMLLLLFYRQLGWLPGPGRLDVLATPPKAITSMYTVDSLLTGNWATLKDSLWHLILPAFCLSYVHLAIVTRLVRSSMLDVLGEDYIRTARACGLPEQVVVYKYGLRNALIPTVTVVGLSFGELLGGAILTETIFAWPGMGRYVVDSIGFLDFPSIMGFTLFISILYVLVNLGVDLLYTILDPKIRYGA